MLTRIFVGGSLISAWFILAAAGIVYMGSESKKNHALSREEYQNLPIEIRQYDKDRDGYLDAEELGRLSRDYELKKR